MSSLHSIVSVQVVWVIAAALGVTILLGLWISTLLSRRWFVTIRKSEETELIAFHIRRIADSLERLAVLRETQPPVQPPVEVPVAKSVGMSAFGR